jgi:hypothetical protein
MHVCTHTNSPILQECNAEIMSIKGWPALWKCASDIRGAAAAAGGGSHASSELDLSDQALPSHEWNNTVTITARGAVIVRLSWSKPLEWDQAVAAKALNACNVICLAIENCC